MNIPNRLTMLRVCLIPIFVWTFLSQNISDWIALIVFSLAGITDFLDGYIARKKNLVTDFGKLMDPLADKLMSASALICYTFCGIINPIAVIIIISREFFVTGLRTIAVSQGKVIAADIWGKIKTVFQDITIIEILVWKSLEGTMLSDFLSILKSILIVVMTILTIISAANYILKNRNLFKNNI